MTLYLCDCCALLLVNGDDSSCRDYYEHDHPQGDLSGIVSADFDQTDWSGFECAGCEIFQLPGANRWEAITLDQVC